MARKKLFGVATVESGSNLLTTVGNATVDVYQAGTSTPIDVYTSEVGGSPASITTNGAGEYEFWIEITAPL